MTGRELIIYILENGLEDEPLFKNGTFLGYKTVAKFAEENGVGVETIKAMILLNQIPGVVMIGDEFLIPVSAKVERYLV